MNRIDTLAVDWKKERALVDRRMMFFGTGNFFYTSTTLAMNPLRITFCKRDNPAIVSLSWKSAVNRGHLQISKPRWAELTEKEKDEVIRKVKDAYLELMEQLTNIRRVLENLPTNDAACNERRAQSGKGKTLVFDGESSWIEQQA